MATTEDWATHETFADDPIAAGTRCILELRARVEALEAQAAQPAQDEQGQGAKHGDSLWHSMYDACCNAAGTGRGDLSWRTAAEIDAVADWLESLGCHYAAARTLRAEAQATREGRRG